MKVDKEYKVGQIITLIGGVKVRVKKNTKDIRECEKEHCYFKGKGYCFNINCISWNRKDHNSVYFERIN